MKLLSRHSPQIKSILLFLLRLFLISILFSTYASAHDRPKVGLALSGGGARGFAHISILKLIDELGMPVDYIAGTSMGGICASLYAAGYSGEYLEKLAMNTNWQSVFNDNPPREHMPYFQKKEDGRYQLDLGMKGLLPVAPGGLISGQNIHMHFLNILYPYTKTMHFDDLFIPFRCVAADLITGKEIILKKGSLPAAVRATMSIPSLFSPVIMGDSLLVDGGMLNNLPVNIVKEMGADLIIAVDVAGLHEEMPAFVSVIDVMQLSWRLLGADRWRQNIEDADFVISPDLRGFTLLDFTSDRVAAIMRQGEAAASMNRKALIDMQAKYGLFCPSVYEGSEAIISEITFHGLTSITADSLKALMPFKKGDRFSKDKIASFADDLIKGNKVENIRYRTSPMEDSHVALFFHVKEKARPAIFEIKITGNKQLPFSFIYRLLGIQPGQALDTDILQRGIEQLYALGYFETVSYRLEYVDAGMVRVILDVNERLSRRLRLGARYDTRHSLILAGSIQETNFPLAGFRFENELIIGGRTQIRAKGYYPSRALNLPIYPFIEFRYKNIPVYIYNGSGMRIASYKDQLKSAELGVGFLISRSCHIQASFIREEMNVEPEIAFTDNELFAQWRDNLNILALEINIDQLDDAFVPGSGFYLDARYEGSFQSLRSERYYQQASLALDFYFSADLRTAFRVFGFYGWSTSGLPVYKGFNMGRPAFFAGLQPDQLFGSRMAILRLEMRYQVHDFIFIKAMANTASALEYNFDIISYDARPVYGFGAGVLINTPLGILEAVLGSADKSFAGQREWQTNAYITIGAKF